MKKILVLLLALLGMSQALAQEYEYVPFVREGVKWVYKIHNYRYEEDFYNNPAIGNNVIYMTLELKGDTVINGKSYKAMHKYCGDAINVENDTVPIYLREEDKVVYGIIPDRKRYGNCPIGFGLIDDGPYNCYTGNEFILYDFADQSSLFSIPEQIMDMYSYKYLYTDTIAVGRHLANRYVNTIDYFNDFYLIEGIGLDARYSYTLFAFMFPDTSMHPFTCSLSHVIEDGEIIYKGMGYNPDCYLPLVREGVKWVYERVTVNGDETSSQYYTYELKGNSPIKDADGRTYKALHYYTGLELSEESDSIICGMREYDAAVESYMNQALNRVIDQGRDMIDFTVYHGADILCPFNSVLSYYKNCQREQFLNDDNFVAVEPVVIDGRTCSRYAYLGEDGEPLAYVVEGIGFDSRDMGDLLTPFTRKPDPDAEYQEYWGLSHVVKDGKIIYKGMRYNPALFEKRGDVNGDGNVTIADVSALIDMLIDVKIGAGGSSYSCDVNGDSNVSIADVSALIDMLLVQP